MHTLGRSSRFSYSCNRCGQCCEYREVPLNAYEIALLAKNESLTPSQFIDEFVDQRTWSLAHRPRGGCVFLESSGCRVYNARPLACRLYPLARRGTASGEELFAEIPPEPKTLGVYGKEGTVADYLKPQEIERHVWFADSYMNLYKKLLVRLRKNQSSAKKIRDLILAHLPIQQQLLSLLQQRELQQIVFNTDKLVPVFCEKRDLKVPQNAEQVCELHLQALDDWIDHDLSLTLP